VTARPSSRAEARTNPDLQQVIDGWGDLPSDLRTYISGLVADHSSTVRARRLAGQAPEEGKGHESDL
jgi:hypothetical protein